MQPYAIGVESPHELIGISPDESDPGVVMETAARRIARIRAASGGELDVRRVLIATIIVARNEVLGRIATGAFKPDHSPRAPVAAYE